jgi:5-methylcytosine-specific restriction endonuclease McrA
VNRLGDENSGVGVWFASPPHDYNIVCNNGYSCMNMTEGARCNNQWDCIIAKKLRSVIVGRTTFYNYRNGENESRHLRDGAISYEDICTLHYNAFMNGFVCPVCGKKMIFGGNMDDSSSIDHIVSRGNGGKNHIDNMRIICYDCNAKKSEEEKPKLPTNVVIEMVGEPVDGTPIIVGRGNWFARLFENV